MMRVLRLAIVIWLSVVMIGLPVKAQGGADGVALYQLNVRSGPGPTYAIVATVPSNTGFVFEARNDDLTWLLGHTEDNAYRGWVASLYLTYREGFAAARLPVSSEEIAYSAPAAPAANPDQPALQPAISGVAPALEAVPVVPTISANAHAIYLRGQTLGNDPRGITRVGECNSMSHAFLMPFGRGQYDLGAYGYLQSTINFFPVSAWTHESVATLAGLSSSMVIDPALSNPNLCAGKSMLECEYSRAKPSVSFIMLGLQDVYFLSAAEYESAMRQVIQTSIDYGVIPVLTTFPSLPGDYGPRDQARLDFNTIVVNLAHEYDIPVINLWLATQSTANRGVGVDFVHVSQRGDNWTAFTGDEYQYGFTMWNLVALQTLAQLQTVMN